MLASLRAPASVPDDVTGSEAVLHLAHGLVGAPEIQAMAAELVARAAGADHQQIHAAAVDAFAAAGAQTRTDSAMSCLACRGVSGVSGVPSRSQIT